MIFRGGENSTGELGNFHPALTRWSRLTDECGDEALAHDHAHSATVDPACGSLQFSRLFETNRLDVYAR
jgi:hypothetical protein